MTPSKRRRLGREAYEPGVDPMDLQPYKKESWGYKMHLVDWLEGWKEGESVFEARKVEAPEPECEHRKREEASNRFGYIWLSYKELGDKHCRDCGENLQE